MQVTKIIYGLTHFSIEAKDSYSVSNSLSKLSKLSQLYLECQEINIYEFIKSEDSLRVRDSTKRDKKGEIVGLKMGVFGDCVHKNQFANIKISSELSKDPKFLEKNNFDKNLNNTLLHPIRCQNNIISGTHSGFLILLTLV